MIPTKTWKRSQGAIDPLPLTYKYYFQDVTSDKLTIIFPEPFVGGAPRGILEQIGVELPPL